MYIRDLMTTEVHTCCSEDSLDHAVRLMWRHDIGVLPVVDGGVVVGMLTDRDAAMVAFRQEGSIHDLRVDQAMTPEAFCCSDNDTVEVAERIMAEHRVRRLPVLDNDRHLVGILSIDDLVRESVRHGVQIPPRDLVHALGSIASRRMFPIAEA